MTLTRLVAAVDFSDSCLEAIEWAAQYFAPEAEFLLLHATSCPAPPELLQQVLPRHDQVLDAIREDASERLRALGETLPTERVTTEVVVGRPAEEIARMAAHWRADLIILGAHGHRFTAHASVGSTAEELVRCSSVPALVARRLPPGSLRRIVASVDDSTMTRRVLESARVLSSASSAELVLVHVVDLGLYGAAGMVGSTDDLAELQERVASATREWLLATAAAVGLDAANLAVHVAFGEPHFEIVAAAEEHNTDLVIIGSRGVAEVGTAHLGRVASLVLRGSSGSVLIITGP